MSAVLTFLQPYDFSPTLVAACTLSVAAYARGLAVSRRMGEHVGFWRALAFFLGVGLIYAVMHTRIDYIAQGMFWVHRAQHLVLHHLAPFLIVLATPQAVLARGVPAPLTERVLAPLWRSPPVQIIYRTVQQPIIAAVLFVGLVYFWLTPAVHFNAMLSLPHYLAMNWSMLIDGLLFWWLILNPERRSHGGLGFGTRIIMLWAITIPQIILGAYIALSKTVLFDVYSVCGRAWPISPLVDQQLGGLITWIPTSMMSVIGGLIVLRMWVRDSARQRSLEPGRTRPSFG